MKARIITKIIIDADPGDVFKFLGDLQYHQLWNPHLKKIAPIMELTTGAVYRTQNFLFGVKISGKVRACNLVTDKELDIESLTGMLQYRVVYRLKKIEDGTLLVCTTAVSSESKAFAFAKPMAQLLAKKEMQSDLELLKRLVEAGRSDQQLVPEVSG